MMMVVSVVVCMGVESTVVVHFVEICLVLAGTRREAEAKDVKSTFYVKVNDAY